MSFCEGCISGVTHEGTPTGKFEKIGGIDTYVAKPTKDYPKDKAVLLLTDIFGVQLVNIQLIADDFAKNGFQVYIPDILDGNPIAADDLNSPDFHAIVGKWIGTRDPVKTPLALYSVINALKGQGITSFAAVGFCFGVRFAFDLAFQNIVQVVVGSHPSFLVIPSDPERLMAHSKAPVLFNQAEVDQQFPIPAQKRTQEILGDGKYAPGYETTYWPGTVHGFAVRGDLSKPEVKAGKEGAFKATVEFLIKHL